MPGEQPYRIVTRQSRITFTIADGDTGEKVLLSENKNRVGFILYNASNSILRLLYGTSPATAERYSTKIGADTEYPFFPDKDNIYTGPVMINPDAPANGTVVVTEFERQNLRTRD